VDLRKKDENIKINTKDYKSTQGTFSQASCLKQVYDTEFVQVK
jgi:RecB family endonuclease NucS